MLILQHDVIASIRWPKENHSYSYFYFLLFFNKYTTCIILIFPLAYFLIPQPLVLLCVQ